MTNGLPVRFGLKRDATRAIGEARMLTGTLTMEPIADRSPDKDCWMLFKVASYEHVKSLQDGKIYMNSMAYLSSFSGEEKIGLRRDDFEQTYLKLNSGSDGRIVRELAMEINGKETILGPESVMTVNLPEPSQIMIFSMVCLAEAQDELIASKRNGDILLSKRFSEFGTHALKINNITEFTKKISDAISVREDLYNSPTFEGRCGQVEYIDVLSHSGPFGVFRKPVDYAWQREYRVCLGAYATALNSRGALELNIGSIADISIIMTVEQLTMPIAYGRRSYRICPVAGLPVEIHAAGRTYDTSGT